MADHTTPQQMSTINFRTMFRAAFIVLMLGGLILATPAQPASADPSLSEVTGRVVVEHGDDPAGGRSVAYRVLETRTERLALEGRGAAGLKAGMTVSLSGERRGNRFILAEREPVLAMSGADNDGSTYAASTSSAGDKRLAVLLVNFNADARQPWTPAAARDVVFDSASSAAAYWNEVSNGKMSLSGDVFGYFTLSNPTSTCDYNGWLTAAQAAARAAGVDLDSYTNIMLAFPWQSSCPWGGLGSLSGPYTWLNGSLSIYLVVHELGHNFGAHHASALSCTDASGGRVALSDTCTSSEYGDPYDVMGSGSRHGNTFHRRLWGFLDTSDQQTVTSTGTYTLAPAPVAGGSPRILRVARPSGSYFYVEYRRPYGTFDAYSASSPAVNGVMIRLGPDATREPTKLIDTTPGTASFTDAALALGKTFHDPIGAISIATVELRDGAASIRITFGSDGPTSADTQAPSAPANLTASGTGETSAALAWTAATDNVAVAGYQIKRDGVRIATLEPSTTAFNEGGLRIGMTYVYKVVAFDAAGNSRAASISYTVPDTMAPTAPTNLKGSTSGGKVLLSWSASVDNSGSVKYQVFRGGVRVATVTTTSYTASPEPGKYTYNVRAIDPSRNVSQPSDSVTVRVAG